MPNKVVVVAAKRTAIGSLMGGLKSLPASVLGSFAIRAAFIESRVNPNDIQEVIMGNVFQAGAGQSSTRQAIINSGLPNTVCATTVNKLCSSGLKAVTLAAQSISLGHSDVIVAGGMESMSSAPGILQKFRSGHQYGNEIVQDSLNLDGLICPYNNLHMGGCAEHTAKFYEISREDQDRYCIASFLKATDAVKRGFFDKEIVKIVTGNKRGEKTVAEDEEVGKVKYDRISKLKPLFMEKGTITAANASSLNDGACALILMTSQKAKSLNLRPLARILSFADSETEPLHFGIAPANSIKKSLNLAGLKKESLDIIEINEAFSAVVLANMKILDLDSQKVNINGGAVSLGHPVGMSGARILTTLIYSLKERQKSIGLAAICNGGGGATSIIIENIS